jgi:hypothetical protein
MIKMSKNKKRIYFNIFAVFVFVSYLALLLFTNIPDIKWSISFVILMSIIYIIRDKLVPKQKRSDDSEKE